MPLSLHPSILSWLIQPDLHHLSSMFFLKTFHSQLCHHILLRSYFSVVWRRLKSSFPLKLIDWWECRQKQPTPDLTSSHGHFIESLLQTKCSWKFIFWSPTWQCDDIWKWSLWEVKVTSVVHSWRPQCPYRKRKNTKRSCEDKERWWPSATQEEGFTKNQICQNLDPGLPGLQNHLTNVCCLSHPAYGILL